MIDFPLPILSVSSEVVKDLDGEDALYGLWTVFTKCKQSLKDGRRLENISWRLWYREMSLANSHDNNSSGSMSPSLSDVGFPSPITPVSESGVQSDFFATSDGSRDSLLPGAECPSRHSWHGGGLPPPTTNVRRLSTASMPARPGARAQHSQRVGSIIVDILPAKAIVPMSTTPRKSPGFSGRRLSGSSSTAKPSPVQTSTASTFVYSSVPKIAAPPSYVAQPRPTLGLPSVQLPSTPSSLAAPRVVVVNPTPHPTPPATPHPFHSNNATSLLPPTGSSPSPVRLVPSKPPATAAPSSLTSASVAPVSNQAAPALPHSEASEEPITTTRAGGDETMKPSDRRFFLQSSESPDRESPERRSPEPHQSSEAPEPSPSSATSSQLKSDGVAPVAPRRNVSKPTVRRGKDMSRFAATRSNSRAQMHRQATQRKVTEPKKTTFNIGSVSSNGTRADERAERVQKPPVAQQSQVVPKPRPPSPAKAAAPPSRKGLVMSTSSEYTTDSDDDSEWASEDNNSHDEKEKERKQRESKLREAAQEAQRQRDMFAKVPKRSYSNLNRTRSGLLSQLLNPDPTIFPPSHPYRQSFQDITQLGRQGGRLPPSNNPSSRSSAAVPLAAQMTPMNAQVPPTNGASNVNAYRSKGRPQGQELEETDTEEEASENGLQLSRSAAQQKLAELAGPSRRRASAQAAIPSHLSQSRAPDRHPHNHHLPSVTSAPIPLAHPYNLPAPAPPMTPRTTRRQMLATELSESLRRNLLWERQVSKVNMLGGARRGGLLGQRLQPLTAANAQQDPAHDQPRNDREERKRAAMARNRSWADDYHYAGW